MTDTIIKQQAIIAAYTVAGGDESKVLEHVKRLGKFVTPGSAMMQAFDAAAEQVTNAPAEKPFPGTLLHVDLEKSSTRGVIFLRNTKGETEVLRTERSDSDAAVKTLLNTLTSMVGHKMLFTKRVETMAGNSNKVRILDAYEDKGIDPAVLDDPEGSGVDWDTWEIKGSPKRDNLMIAGDKGLENLLPTAVASYEDAQAA